ncbi:hypothetical protein ACHAWO_012488 [Cyclotella atomus]|uniref:tRNA pseudouridine synthase n=1 Tax=Cyclotella atomus TaxID=382360 RepID=A0ABD3NC84_9STRA
MLARQWRRYALAVQYHGGNALGFSYQGPRGENCLVYEPRSNGTIIQADLRGIESIEGRIRRALNCLVGRDNYQNIQVSSRTDRGVHAWRNTFQVDIRLRLAKSATTDAQPSITCDGSFHEAWDPKKLVHGINYYLSRLPGTITEEEENAQDRSFLFNRQSNHRMQSNNTIRILSAAVAPNVRVPNHNYDPNLPQDADNPIDLPWDVRFTATRRFYAYRILHSFDMEHESDNDSGVYSTACYHSYPFEDDRVWRIHERNSSRCRNKRMWLDVNAMNLAGVYLTGTHDFTSFRGKGCQRFSPIVTVESISCTTKRYHDNAGEGILNAALRHTSTEGRLLSTPDTLKLVTIVISGNSFVYHQIRNIVACLVEVGQGKMTPEDVKAILEKKDRSCAVGMAPPQGLFLVDVEHGDFIF